MGDLLSQDEIDALLSATEGEDSGETPNLDTGGQADEVANIPRASDYDFKHPARVNKEQLRTLENMHENFARLLGTTFSGSMRAVVDVETAFVDQTTYAEFIMSLSNPSCSYQFAMGPSNGQAIIDFAMPLVFAFVDRVFGGKGSSQGIEARILTQIEIGVMSKIIRRVIEDLEAAWDPFIRVEISDVDLEVNPEFLQITAPSETVILLAFEVNSTHASGLVNLCYPFFSLESILPRLSQNVQGPKGRHNREELLEKNRLRLEKTYMPIRAELARSEVTFQQLQGIEVGDVLRMDTEINEPTVVYVDNEPKFLSQPGRIGNKNAVQIQQKIEPADEEIFRIRSKEAYNLTSK